MNGNQFAYYKLTLKLMTQMLGTATETSIYNTHVIEKAKKEIEKANKLKLKITKNIEKYIGNQISEKKEIDEIKSVLRAYCQLIGRPLDIPETVEEILEYTKEVEEEFKDQLKEGQQVDAKVFLRNQDGHAIISTHMILGNVKEILRNSVNNGDKSILPSKVSVGEVCALDLKFVEDFIVPSNDILKASSQEEVDRLIGNGKGKYVLDRKNGRVILERPVRFNDQGVQKVAINSSEVLPEGTELECTLRVRQAFDENGVDISKFTEDKLRKIFTFGKNCGLGAWRGSGNMGAYKFKLERLHDYKEDLGDGWS